MDHRTDEEIWQNYLTWLRDTPRFSSPGEMRAGFVRHLVESGSTEDVANRVFGVVLRLQRERSDWTAILFDKVYSDPTPGFRLEPNALVARSVEGDDPGTALEVAMGQGRNAVFLAANGWDVTGFDLSGEGVGATERNAAAVGVSINTVVATHRDFDYGSERWDLIVSTYSVAPLEDPEHVSRLEESLRHGGRIVVESYASGTSEPIRRPVDLDPYVLREVFGGFEVLLFEDVADAADWSPPGELNRVVRMVVRRR